MQYSSKTRTFQVAAALAAAAVTVTVLSHRAYADKDGSASADHSSAAISDDA